MRQLPFVTFGAFGTVPVSGGGTGTSLAFTPGSIVFAGPGGIYQQDNGNLFWDDTNKRLGLGTSPGTNRLTVKGSTAGIAELFYGTPGTPAAPDLTFGYNGLGVSLYTNGNMVGPGGVSAISGNSVRNSGQEGLTYGGIFQASVGGTWTGVNIDSGAIGMLCVGGTSRAGTIFGLSANLDVSGLAGAIARIAEFDSGCTVNVASKKGLILVSRSNDVGVATSSETSNSGRSINDSICLELVSVPNGVGGGGVGWMYGLSMIAPAGGACQPVQGGGALFIADGFTVTRGLDWYTMNFTEHAIGLGNTQKVSWRNAANNAFVDALTVDSGDRLSFYGGKAVLTAAGVAKLAGTAVRGITEGTNHLDIFDGTAPVGTLANGISLYSTAGELWVMDAGGTATQLSPHSRDSNEWIYHSVDTRTGKGLRIDVERMMRTLNERFGYDFVHEFKAVS